MDDKWLMRIRRYEGLCVLPYRCPSGHLTIGYGHNLENGISPAAAEYILQEDVARCVQALQGAFAWYETLSAARQFVLVDMAFNMGIAKLKTFKKMLAACKAGHYTQAASEMLESLWARQVGRRALENAQLMRRGTFEEEK